MLFTTYDVVTPSKNTFEFSEKDEKEISNKIEKVLHSRATILVSGKKTLNEIHFESRKANIQEKQQQNQILQFRNELKKEGETYSSTRTNISVLSSEKVLDEVISVGVIERTYLTISGTNIETGYDAKHEFIFEKDGNNWIIIEDRQLEPTGLLPLSDAKKYVKE